MENLETTPTEVKERSFGEQLVDLVPDSTDDATVIKAKQLCAELADLIQKKLWDKRFSDNPPSIMYETLHYHAIGQIINAELSVVKVLTAKI